MRSPRTDLLLVLLIFCTGPSQAAAEGTAAKLPSKDHMVSVEAAGRARRALIHVPAQARHAGMRPLIIALHGHGGTAARMRRRSRLNAAADALGFLVAYPEGTSWRDIPWRGWNAGTCCGFSRETAVDDVAFLRALMDRLIAEHAADPDRIFVTGISNGGMMAYRAACELSDRIAAVAVVAGAMNPEACEPSVPVDVMIIHGTADRRVPYAGGRAPNGRVDASVADAVGFWQRHNGGAAEVAVQTIEGGGHEWPAGATDAIAEFFSRHAGRTPE